MGINERYYVLLEKMAAREQYDGEPLTEAEMAEFRALIRASTCPECHACAATRWTARVAVDKKHCNEPHPWWPGIRCELEPDHRTDNHVARLEDHSHIGAKIKWPKGEEMGGHVHTICAVCNGCQTGPCDLRSCNCSTQPR